MQRIAIKPAGDLTILARRWLALEDHASPNFFRSWTFLGCLAEQRFHGAHLLATTQDGQDVALALLGRASRRRWLNQTGNPARDSVFIEHNGVLAAPAADLPAILRAARGTGRLVLAGIDGATLHAATAAGWISMQQSRWAPAVALDTLHGPYLDTLSANARAQIRRSQRLYGPDLHLSRAETLPQAHAHLTEMIALHQATWNRRGKPGAFAHPDILAFHHALVARAWPDGTDLLRITAHGRHLGTLYMLIRNRRVHSYQSGFAYTGDGREKPGLVCHALAIQHYADLGARTYDLLAGADRYKLTLAQGGEMLHWAVLHRPWSVSGLARMAGERLRR